MSLEILQFIFSSFWIWLGSVVALIMVMLVPCYIVRKYIDFMKSFESKISNS